MYEEGKAHIKKTKNVFLNPEMRICRDISVAVVEDWPKKGNVIDCMCATGIRGIRYALEAGAGNVWFLDANEEAIKDVRKNAKANGVKGKFVVSDANQFFFSTREKFDVIEIDPFGTPAPYFFAAVRAAERRAMISATATDTAVLCGAHTGCEKIYNSVPAHTDNCKEIGLRILLGKLARDAAQWNFRIKPLVSLSSKHFMKVFVGLEWGAKFSDRSAMQALGSFSYCEKCFYRSYGWKEKCECGTKMKHAGPLWAGTLFTKMPKSEYKEADKLLQRMGEEKALQNYPFYHLHNICAKLKVSIPSFEKLFERIKKKGYGCSRTHIEDKGFRTDMPIKEILEVL